jgi:hypothetical protein
VSGIDGEGRQFSVLFVQMQYKLYFPYLKHNFVFFQSLCVVGILTSVLYALTEDYHLMCKYVLRRSRQFKTLFL